VALVRHLGLVPRMLPRPRSKSLDIPFKAGLASTSRPAKDDDNLDKTPGLVFRCARHSIVSHNDFQSQKSILEETITAVDFLCYKYHCKLNLIVAYWGSTKRYAPS